MSSSAASGDRELSLALRLVRSLLDRHGIAKYRQSAWLANATGLSYSQAHRRLNGTSPWSLEDLAEIAALFDETLADLVKATEPGSQVAAVLRTGGEFLNCQVWLGDAIPTPLPGRVFAVRSKAGWVIATFGDQVPGDAFEIRRLEAHPGSNKRRRVAVVDDDPNIADSIVSSFELLGFSASAFYSAATLLSAFAKFDCFVLDWVVGDETVLELVRSLRSADAACPIVILTGQVSTGSISEADIADAIKQHGLLFCEKPVRASILAAMLTRAFATRPSQ